jgi:hypothetical protein
MNRGQEARVTGIARRMTMGAVLAIAAGAGRVESAAAQAELLGPGAGFITVGAAGIDTGELDDWLAARGYPVFGSTALTVGLGAYRVLSSGVMLGGEFNGVIVGEEAHEGREVGIGGGSATLGIGYAVDVSPRARVYPRLGLGIGGMALWSERRDTVDFEDVLEGPAPPSDDETVLSRDGVVVDLGAGAEFLPRGPGGPLIGVRAGYLAGPFTSSWDTDERTVIGGPDASISGPYLRLAIGWAWRR